MVKSRSLKVIGLSEPEIAQKIEGIAKDNNNLSLELLANEMEVKLKIIAEDKDEKSVDGMIETLENKIRKGLGDYIFGVDEETLEKVVGGLLVMRRKTIALAESCTGGLTSHRLTNIPGSSAYFQGSVVAYSNGVKERILQVSPETMERFGAVSRETVQAMAWGIKEICGADLGLAITGIAGPGGETASKPIGLIYMALAVDQDISIEEHHFSGEREGIKSKASQTALDMVRRYLIRE